jgi:hypothetical protein
MADIFLSYTEKDRDTARRLAATLESVGWSVWWDRRIPAGETWRNVLEHALEDMRCMVVLWSANSIESEWVCEEATEGRRLGKLVPVQIESVRPPAGFREIQAADLTDWDGSREFEGMRRLIGDLERHLGNPVTAKGRTSGVLAGASDVSAETAESADRGRPYDPADLHTDAAAVRRSPSRMVLAIGLVGVLVLAGGAAYFGVSWRETSVKSNQVSEPARHEPIRTAPSTTAESEPPKAAASTPEVRSPSAAERAALPAPAKGTGAVTRSAAGKRNDATRATATSERCADLLVRMQLGEALSDDMQTLFRKECSR